MAKGRESKPHIGIFGRRNNGKSSLINALAGQDIAIVSDVAGTTTDPVKKSIEIHGIGPVIMVDTAGIDDTGELGLKRIARTEAALKTIDLAILVVVNNAWDVTKNDWLKSSGNTISRFLSCTTKPTSSLRMPILSEKSEPVTKPPLWISVRQKLTVVRWNCSLT
jgi:predicted GTPase